MAGVSPEGGDFSMSSEEVGIPHSDLTEVRTTLNPLTLEFTPFLASHLTQYQAPQSVAKLCSVVADLSAVCQTVRVSCLVTYSEAAYATARSFTHVDGAMCCAALFTPL